MRRIGVLFVFCMIIMGTMLVGWNENSEAVVQQYIPSDNERYLTVYPLSTAENAYASDNNYAVAINHTHTASNVSVYKGYDIEPQGTEITMVEIGWEYYQDVGLGSAYMAVSCDAGTTWQAVTGTTVKNADDDTVDWIDITDYATCSPWAWDDLNNDNFRVYVQAVMDVGVGFYLDFMPVRVTSSGEFRAQVQSPSNGQSVYRKIDFNALVVTSGTVEQVTFRTNASSTWYVAEEDEDSGNYVYRDFNTLILSNGWYALTVRANLTTGAYATDTISMRVNNAEGRNCVFDDIKNEWICKHTRFFVPHKFEGLKGMYELTKGVEDTYWCLMYRHELTGTGASVTLGSPVDSTTYTDYDVFADEVHLSGYDYSNRVWINDTGTSTILVNDTYVSFYEADGEALSIESAVALEATRKSEVIICSSFNWPYDQYTDSYSYVWAFTNGQSGTMEDLNLWVPFKYPADIDTVNVYDQTGGSFLDPAKDYLLTDSGVSVGFMSLASGSTQTINIDYQRLTKNPANTMRITITDGDVDDEPVQLNNEDYTRASKDIFNGNTYDIQGGTLIVTFQTSMKPDMSSMRCYDEDDSAYVCYPEAGVLVVQDFHIESGENKKFYFYYNSVDDSYWVEVVQKVVLPIVILLLLIMAVVALAILARTSPDDKEKISTYRLVCLGGFVVAAILALLVYVVPVL
jgi:hypothetical protein